MSESRTLKMCEFRLIVGPLCAVAAFALWRPAAAQTPPLRPRPAVAPIELSRPPPGIALPVPSFANIQVRVIGPHSVQISWIAYPGADAYGVNVNGGPIAGSPFPVAAGTSAVDLQAPTNVQLGYTVTALHKTTIFDASGKSHGGTGEMPMPGASTSKQVIVVIPPPLAPLWGYVDLHTHPMSNLAFAGKLFHGAPDAVNTGPFGGPGSLMPAVQLPTDTQCRFDVRAANMSEALSNDAPTQGPSPGPGLPGNVPLANCGDWVRAGIVVALESFNGAVVTPLNAIGAAGSGPPGPNPPSTAPPFANWPRWNDITHQKMWWEWIQRAHQFGGLNVMVGLAHNSRTIAEHLGQGGPISGHVDDFQSAELQITEMKTFVSSHRDFMEVALSSADLYRIVSQGHLAVVLGVEIDNIGDFNDLKTLDPATVDREIGRLFAEGVRYIFPIHLTDNVFGDTAIYSDFFDISNYRETGKFWTVGCGRSDDLVSYHAISINFPSILSAFTQGLPTPHAPDCGASAGAFMGHVNVRTPQMPGGPAGMAGPGLTPLGEWAIKSMMMRGMIIDIDHMSNLAVNRMLQIAEAIPNGGYPLMSGHSAVRNPSSARFNAENSRTPAQLQRIACLGGMFGLGTDGAQAFDWANQYWTAFSAMNGGFSRCASYGQGFIAMGTDMNSFVRTPRPPANDFDSSYPPPGRQSVIYDLSNRVNQGNPNLPALSKSSTGGRTWDYNIDGVAHYGMYADFIRDVRTSPQGLDLVDNHLLRSADYFWHAWQKIEAQKASVR